MRNWLLWRLRPAALGYVLTVEAVAVALVALVFVTGQSPTAREWQTFIALSITAFAVIVITSVSIKMRRHIRRDPWTLHIVYLAAGILLLPPNLLVLLLLGPSLHGVLDNRAEPHRWLFTTAATGVAVFTGRALVGWVHPVWNPITFFSLGVVLLMLRAMVVAGSIWLRKPTAKRQAVLGEPIDVLLGIVAASLGGLLAVAMNQQPVSVLLAAPAMVLLDLASQLPTWRRSAQRDSKTGLANAEYWERTARLELVRARQRGLPVAVLLADLDHFKKVNDEIGHLAGDTVLAAIAMMLQANVRDDDVVGRFGGEEFVILLPGSEPQSACKIAERIRMASESLSVPARDIHGEHRDLTDLTVSIGVATTSRYGYELTDLLVAADAAMLKAKANGRNNVRLA